MIYFLYDILLLIAALVYLPFYAIRGRVCRKTLCRLGLSDGSIPRPKENGRTVWVHAVSVGEARLSESIVRLARELWPQDKIVVSTVTPTGYEILKKFLGDEESIFYAPLDISCIVAKFIRLLRPRVLLIMETELWPNLIRLNAAAGTKIAVINGRISDKSFEGYRKIMWFIAPVLKKVGLFCMQSEESAERMKLLSAPQERVKVTGNIKFDLRPAPGSPVFMTKLRGLLQGRILWVCGSTHENEEEQVLSIYKSLRKDFDNLRLAIAPRHIERIDKIRRLVRVNGFEAVFLSRINSFSGTQIALLDTMGDLSALYSLADLVFVGGSLVSTGGHNPIEPALFGKPILFGDHMDNFREIRDIFIREKAALEVQDSQSLEYELRRLLASPSERGILGENARGLLDKNRGAAQRTLKEIQKEMGL